MIRDKGSIRSDNDRRDACVEPLTVNELADSKLPQPATDFWPLISFAVSIRGHPALEWSFLPFFSHNVAMIS